MHLAHHPAFVTLSVLVACLGSWTALDLFRRVRAHSGAWRMAWLAASGIAMGLSIWSMHFIAMLGFNPGGEVRYRIGLTVLSLLLAIGATTCAFFAVNDRSTRRLLAAGTFMGLGICTMHYVGMAAMLTNARIVHEGRYVVLAFIIATTASTGALIAARGERALLQRALAAVVLGFAIVGMHYTAMLGVRLLPSSGQRIVESGLDPMMLAVGVAAGTSLILFLALIAALSDRRFEALAAREALRGEQRLRAIMEHLPFGIFVAARPSGEILFSNAEAEALLRHSVAGATVWNMPETYGALDEDGASLPAEKHVLYQAMHEGRRVGPRVQAYRRGDGSIAQLEITAAPISPGDERAAAVVAFQDVTTKLLAEQEARSAATLRGSEERFRLAAEHAPMMLWLSDTSGAHTYGNRALRDFCGFNGDAPVTHWLDALMSEDREAFHAQFTAALQTRSGFASEARFRRADGSPRIVQITARVRSNDRDEFLGLIGVNVDVTEIRHAQSELLRMNEILEERVSAALAEKARAQEELMHAQRLEALGRLTGGVAHDFNNLLTVVIGALDIILRHPENHARRTKLGEAALAAARRGERLTTQLLAFARRQPLRTEPCDLNALIREIEPLLVQRASGERLSLHLRLSATPAVIRIDPSQFESALLNLIVNAVDATSAGGVITIETRLRTLEEAEMPEVGPGRFFCILVSDTGEGMSADVVKRIFEPFFTTKPSGKGTGLGLSQVYGFVRQSGGTVRVHSVPGRGTTVELYLPVLREGVQAKAETARADRPPLSLDVLLVEDDASVAAVTETMLKSLGHEVARAQSAHQALDVLRSGAELDVLITDIAMPGGMNGLELARAASLIRPELKILLVSGYAGEPLDEALASDAWPFLKKPYLEETLDTCLRALVSQPPLPAAVRGERYQ